jgi:sarcosine oxidase delta subunit
MTSDGDEDLVWERLEGCHCRREWIAVQADAVEIELIEAAKATGKEAERKKPTGRIFDGGGNRCIEGISVANSVQATN